MRKKGRRCDPRPQVRKAAVGLSKVQPQGQHIKLKSAVQLRLARHDSQRLTDAFSKPRSSTLSSAQRSHAAPYQRGGRWSHSSTSLVDQCSVGCGTGPETCLLDGRSAPRWEGRRSRTPPAACPLSASDWSDRRHQAASLVLAAPASVSASHQSHRLSWASILRCVGSARSRNSAIIFAGHLGLPDALSKLWLPPSVLRPGAMPGSHSAGSKMISHS